MIASRLLLWIALLACTESRGAVSAEKSQAPSASGALGLTEVASGLHDPVYLIAPPHDSRLFVVEKPGRIRIVKNGVLLPTPFLDITAKVKSSGLEQGLLSVAFHPSYAANRYFYVNYTDVNGDTQVERYTASSTADVADASSAKRILFVKQPYANHNGGLNLFGPDGMLYIGFGDGGSGGDPHRNGQNTNVLLGKLLRIDVDHGDPYSIPRNNPFANGGGRGEVWAYGLRNPWRYAFDPSGGNIFIADVGQDKFEEIDVTPANRAGVNYGWNVMEGASCFKSDTCDRSGLQMPVISYGREGGACSVIGGFVYRGSAVPQLVGHYVYSDWCAGWIRSFKFANGTATDRTEWKTPSHGTVLSFGQDASGELYVLSANGRVYKITKP